MSRVTSGFCGVPAPVPRFVGNTLGGGARGGGGGAERGGGAAPPRKRGRTFEIFLECCKSGRGEIDGAAAVVFAVTRRRADPQDLVDRLAAREFALENAELVFDRTKRRHDLQVDAVARRGFAHPGKCARRACLQPLWSTVDVGTDGDKPRRFALQTQVPDAAVVTRHAQCVRAFDQRAAFRSIAATPRGRHAVAHGLPVSGATAASGFSTSTTSSLYCSCSSSTTSARSG